MKDVIILRGFFRKMPSKLKIQKNSKNFHRFKENNFII